MGTSSDSSRRATAARAAAPTLSAFLVFAVFPAGTIYCFVRRLIVINWMLWWVGVPLLLAEIFSVFGLAWLAVYPQAE